MPTGAVTPLGEMPLEIEFIYMTWFMGLFFHVTDNNIGSFFTII